jgi:hypothetical protein
VIGHENLTKPDIAAAIEKARAERAERAKLTGDMVVDELRKIGFASRPGLDAAEGLGSADVLKITDPAAVLVGVATAFVADNRRSRSPIALKVC